MRNSGENIPAKSVDEYLAPLPADVRAALEKLRRTIRAAAPQAEELISYQIPTYRYFGALLHFAAFPGHCSLYVVNKEIFALLEKELQDYRTSGTTIRFSPEKPLPAGLVRKIVAIRLRQNEERKSPVSRILTT